MCTVPLAARSPHGPELDQPPRGSAALLHEVRAQERRPQGGVVHVDGAISEDDRNLRGLGLAEDRLPSRLDHGRKGDDVDLLLR